MLLALVLFVGGLSLARSLNPLLNRDDAAAIPSNYIVVLRSDLHPDNVTSHYDFVQTITQGASSAHRGLVRTFDNIDGFSAYHIECDDFLLETVRSSEHVEYVAQDSIVTRQGESTYPQLATVDSRGADTDVPWGLARISHRNPGANTYIEGPVLPPARLYGVDTGIKIDHPEFGGRAIWGANFVNNNNTDENGHGTHTAATACGNTVGVDNRTTVIAVKCLDENAQGSWSGIIAALNWVVNDAQAHNSANRSVINMSLGGPSFPALDQAVNATVAAGLTVVCASSNYNADACTYSPAEAPSAITVGAINASDIRPDWSNYGKCVDIFAPGQDIRSAWIDRNNPYMVMSGTSMASPHVAGLATYLMRTEGLQGPAAVRQKIEELATAGLVQNAKGSANLISFNGNLEQFGVKAIKVAS